MRCSWVMPRLRKSTHSQHRFHIYWLSLRVRQAANCVLFFSWFSYRVNRTYLFAALGPLGFALSQASQIGISVWLQNWASTENSGDQPSVGTLLGVYAALVALYIICDTGVNLVILVSAGIRAARILHRNLLQTVMRLPMRYTYDLDEHSLSIQQGHCKEQTANLHFCYFIHALLSQYSFFDTTP